MSHDYTIHHPVEVSAWAALSTGPGPVITYHGIRAPVFDLYGANDLPQVLTGAARRKASLKDHVVSKQTVIPDAGHFFAGHEEAMTRAVVGFRDSVK